jgi:hypothetical protein
MEPLDQIVPNQNHPALALTLPKKTGRVPKGSYRFTEQYCADPGEDCRGVTILVVDEKQKQKALIKFGFDQDGPFAGPYLDPASRQAPYAEALLELFVDSLNTKPQWLDQLYRHYREVRKVVDGKPYRGKPFPEPGRLVYHAMPPPDLQAQIEQSLRALGKPATAAPRRSEKPAPPPAPRHETLDTLLSRYVQVGTSGPINELLSLQSELRQYILQNEGAERELAELLPDLFQQSPQDDERIEASLRLLYDLLQMLQFDVESSVGKPRMAELQGALAHRVFQENEDLDLRVAVSNTIVHSRVEILPVLQEASSRMMIASAGRSDLHDLPGEEILSGILRSLHSMGVTSPFEGAEELLQLFTLNDAELQTALVAEMMEGDEPLLKEIAALMLFHPEPQVRLGVSLILAARGEEISPQTLRRLIVSRNWFTGELRKNVDQAIVNARKARVECAPLPRGGVVTVYATAVDDSGRQSFNIGVEQGENLYKAAVVLQQGVGIVEASAAELTSRRELDRFLSRVKSQPNFSDSSLELLDLRVCHGLDEGLVSGRIPKHWLLRCAELIGRDSWRPIRFDAGRELLQMREDLDAAPGGGAEIDPCGGADESASWQDRCSFLSGWVEEEDVVDRALESWRPKGKKPVDPAAATEHLADTVMEERRPFWLERLVWTALWLKASKKPALPWQKMFRMAKTVADETVAMKEIPLMLAIAASSVSAWLGRRQGSKTKTGER